MRLSQNGLELIKEFEGFSPTVYKCAGGKQTIGYGHVIQAHESHLLEAELSESEATALLMQDVKRFEQGVSRLVTVPVHQNQADALISFAFNLGVNALAGSTLLRRLNTRQYHQAALQFDRWVHVGKRKLKGLVRRRAAERALFESKHQPGNKETEAHREKVKMFVRLIEKKVKDFIDGFIDELDLDGDGVKDKEQVMAMVGKLSEATQKLIAAVNQEELAGAAGDIAAITKEIDDLMKRINKAIDKPKATEALASAQEALVELGQFLGAIIKK